MPVPADTNDPERTSSPTLLVIASDSPVSSDSSTSSPSERPTTPSTTIWSPGPTTSRSSSTTWSIGTSQRRSSRITTALGALSSASWSRVRLARSSWTMPMRALVTSTTPKRPSCGGATIRMTTRSTPRTRLKMVKTFALTISATVRVAVCGTSLIAPAAIRCRTSAALRPTSGGSCWVGAACSIATRA